MSHCIKILLFSFLMVQSLAGQDCGCTIAEVESNTVAPCQTTIGTVVNVSTESEFRAAIAEANQTGGNMTILIADGTYAVASTASYPYITASNLIIRSASGNRDAVVLTGQGMQDAGGTEIVLYLVGDNITVADLTIRDCGNHGIAMNSDHHFIHNVKIQDTYEQMIKANSAGAYNDSTVIQCSLFEYTAGVGPQWYIGGLDIHSGVDFVVRDNVFRNINSPSQTLAEHAIHFWDDSSNNLVERNKITNCDRGIGFGLGSSANDGGIIRNNTIVNDGTTPYHDVGIGLESSPNTQVYNNTVMIAYQNAIEYRFEVTTDVTITNNLTNRAIRSRNGGTATVTANITDAELSWFVDPFAGDLHLSALIPAVVDQGVVVTDLVDDIDQDVRPNNSGIDIGADEYLQTTFVDMDMDGFNTDEDCDDTNPAINPDAMEVAYNGLDDDCNPETLDDDLDQDGFLMAEDCDDTDPAINPDATEIAYNGLDDDCNPETLDDDLDQDGFLIAEDCDDTDPDINPDATEVAYNGIDDDCNIETLDDDLDQDGFFIAEDCDDTDPAINPDAEEIPNNDVDENCDGEILVVSVEEEDDELITFYPNPFIDEIYSTIDLNTKSVTLIDCTGRVQTIVPIGNRFDLSHLSMGLYYIQITDTESRGSEYLRIVKL